MVVGLCSFLLLSAIRFRYLLVLLSSLLSTSPNFLFYRVGSSSVKASRIEEWSSVLKVVECERERAGWEASQSITHLVESRALTKP